MNRQRVYQAFCTLIEQFCGAYFTLSPKTVYFTICNLKLIQIQKITTRNCFAVNKLHPLLNRTTKMAIISLQQKTNTGKIVPGKDKQQKERLEELRAKMSPFFILFWCIHGIKVCSFRIFNEQVKFNVHQNCSVIMLMYCFNVLNHAFFSKIVLISQPYYELNRRGCLPKTKILVFERFRIKKCKGKKCAIAMCITSPTVS